MQQQDLMTTAVTPNEKKITKSMMGQLMDAAGWIFSFFLPFQQKDLKTKAKAVTLNTKTICKK